VTGQGMGWAFVVWISGRHRVVLAFGQELGSSGVETGTQVMPLVKDTM
jgi:hypothetical protein